MFKIKFYFSLIFFLYIGKTMGQDIVGQLEELKNKSVVLEAFDGLSSYPVDSTKTDPKGKFKLSYTTSNQGMGLLKTEGGESILLVLEPEDIHLTGTNASDYTQLNFLKGKENKQFLTYVNNQPIRDQSYSAWSYLAKLYQDNELLKDQKLAKSAIDTEIKRLKNEEASFLAQLPESSYIKWYIPVRKLLSSVAQVAQYRPEEIPATRQALQNLDYADERLYTSGLLKDALENHVWFIENSSGALDQVFADLNESIDLMLAQLIHDEAKYNTLTEYLFNLLEKRSLFTSAEHLALKVLNEQSCSLNDDVAKQLESYRQMKKGNTAPDIRFGQYTYFPEGMKAASLKEIDATYKVVVFAAGWCGHCREQTPQLVEHYTTWKDKAVEVVLVSLDENTTDFANFTGALPFVSTTTLMKWDTKAAQDYHIYATPSYFLLDKDLKIILKPKNLAHLNAYIQQLKN